MPCQPAFLIALSLDRRFPSGDPMGSRESSLWRHWGWLPGFGPPYVQITTINVHSMGGEGMIIRGRIDAMPTLNPITPKHAGTRRTTGTWRAGPH